MTKQTDNKISPTTYKIKRVLAFFLMLWLGYTVIANTIYLLTFGNSGQPGAMFLWTLFWTVVWGFVCYKSYLVFRGKI